MLIVFIYIISGIALFALLLLLAMRSVECHMKYIFMTLQCYLLSALSLVWHCLVPRSSAILTKGRYMFLVAVGVVNYLQCENSDNYSFETCLICGLI